MAKVAIVILNWNGQKMLAKYLSGVVEYSRQDAEVWVADNSSTDGSMHLLETQYPQVKTIVLEQNFGFAEGYNQALKQIEAEYYVLLNSDVEVTHHWLTPLIEFMDSLKDTPPAERITIFVQKSTTSTSIFKAVLIVFCQQFRLTGCHLRMTVHKLDAELRTAIQNAGYKVTKIIR